jgi:hypothetical protein
MSKIYYNVGESVYTTDGKNVSRCICLIADKDKCSCCCLRCSHCVNTIACIPEERPDGQSVTFREVE